MRPLALALRSFGPFAGEQRVDFTRYGDNAFLLIHGVTGAGKTTILDGICYALYGDASGEKREDHYLRSQLARPDSPCEVEFHFQVGPRRFQVKRTPPQAVTQKGKKRNLLHQVEFCQVDEHGAIIGDRLTRVGEVQKKVEEVIGFTSSQFRQVVVLPQGEFRRLLLARSDEKEQILEKLFGTGRYKLAEEWLKRKRASLAGELKDLKAAVEGILTSNGAATPGELQERRAALGIEQARLGAMIVEQEALLSLAQERLLAARSLAERFLEQERAATIHGELERQKPDMEQNSMRVERARKALGLADLLDALQRAERELVTQRDRLIQLDARISTLDGTRGAALERAARARAASEAIPALTAEQALLTTRLERFRELAAGTVALAAAQKSEHAAAAEVDRQKRLIIDSESRHASLCERIETLSLDAGTAGQLAGELEKVATLLAARKGLAADTAELEHLLGQIAVREKAVAGAAGHHGACEQGAAELQQRFIRGQSALFAKELHDGAPCPVCGSPDHPDPAQAAEHVPSETDLDAARKSVADALKLLQREEKELNRLIAAKSAREAAVATVTASLGADAGSPAARLEERRAALEQRLAAGHAAAAELSVARRQRDQLSQVISPAKQKLAAAEAELMSAAAEHEKQKALAERLERETAGADRAAVEARLKEIGRTVEAAGRELQQAEAELRHVEEQLAGLKGQREEKLAAIPRLQSELARLNDGFVARLGAEGFRDRQECLAARMPLEEIERLQQEVDRFRDALTAAAERLQRAVQGCEGVERPNLAAVTEIRDGIDQHLGGLRKEAGVLQGQQKGIDDALAAIGEKGNRIAVLDSEYAVVGRLADVAGGSNQKRMTLQRYVLAALFEEVAMAASQRLSRMSRGRYHLVRSEAPRDGKSTSGLDLDVTDDYIGEKRPAFTLSGGESFLASLSLALGLSDVVMAQCGGRYLDCIFIDEGFGSLDGETLDKALDTLVELHRSGRVIGIISHVAELKDRIPSQIEVVGSKDGSRIVQLEC